MEHTVPNPQKNWVDLFTAFKEFLEFFTIY